MRNRTQRALITGAAISLGFFIIKVLEKNPITWKTIVAAATGGLAAGLVIYFLKLDFSSKKKV